MKGAGVNELKAITGGVIRTCRIIVARLGVIASRTGAEFAGVGGLDETSD